MVDVVNIRGLSDEELEEWIVQCWVAAKGQKNVFSKKDKKICEEATEDTLNKKEIRDILELKRTNKTFMYVSGKPLGITLQLDKGMADCSFYGKQHGDGICDKIMTELKQKVALKRIS